MSLLHLLAIRFRESNAKATTAYQKQLLAGDDIGAEIVKKLLNAQTKHALFATRSHTNA
jgi:hypothetical protein